MTKLKVRTNNCTNKASESQTLSDQGGKKCWVLFLKQRWNQTHLNYSVASVGGVRSTLARWSVGLCNSPSCHGFIWLFAHVISSRANQLYAISGLFFQYRCNFLTPAWLQTRLFCEYAFLRCIGFWPAVIVCGRHSRLVSALLPVMFMSWQTRERLDRIMLDNAAKYLLTP